MRMRVNTSFLLRLQSRQYNVVLVLSKHCLMSGLHGLQLGMYITCHAQRLPPNMHTGSLACHVGGEHSHCNCERC